MLREYLNVLLLWFSTTVGEDRLWERLRIYSGKLFIAIKTKIQFKFHQGVDHYSRCFKCAANIVQSRKKELVCTIKILLYTV